MCIFYIEMTHSYTFRRNGQLVSLLRCFYLIECSAQYVIIDMEVEDILLVVDFGKAARVPT